ncbi:PilW family protein [Motilibacter deserti]|uniref:Prepilin-type N-terminal cleavage/methylation domain-containing protein n=1 Tax=Motilibacter deserti TaxID=2714956 RepID=A0ABX0GSY2_9ACTN|nr:prepilin-type N-terminal cleavage/methylation domain-containing protein [Motilibacter deserti]NHC14008.1 hypothetical protein [Motilibacter deserti]
MTLLQLLRRRRPNGDSGITLAELVVAMFVGGIVLSGVTALSIAVQGSVGKATARSSATSDVRIALGYMTARLRVAVSPDGGATPAFTYAGPDKVVFYASLSKPSNRPTRWDKPRPVKVEYWVDSGTGCLMQAETAPTEAAAPYSWTSGRTTTCLARGTVNPPDSTGTRRPIFTYYAQNVLAMKEFVAVTPDATGAVADAARPSIASVAIDLSLQPAKPAGVTPARAQTRLTLPNLLKLS